jgi:hypothetical protein
MTAHRQQIIDQRAHAIITALKLQEGMLSHLKEDSYT